MGGMVENQHRGIPESRRPAKQKRGQLASARPLGNLVLLERDREPAMHRGGMAARSLLRACMSYEAINFDKKFSLSREQWQPRVVGLFGDPEASPLAALRVIINLYSSQNDLECHDQ
jgi:hypothetical protein